MTEQPDTSGTPAAEPTGERIPVRRALVSVYDKTGLVDLARALVEQGVEIVSTGSTAKTIAGAGLAVTPVEDVTGFPECLDGRVKTLHPKVHAGLLADLRLETHRSQLDELGVAPFQLLVSNLYPFTQTVASGASPDECVEQIDIGGPAMVRASAKNHPSVAVLTSPLVNAQCARTTVSDEQMRTNVLTAPAHSARWTSCGVGQLAPVRFGALWRRTMYAPIRPVKSPIRTTVSASMGRRPRRSPSTPNTMPPTGRITNETA